MTAPAEYLDSADLKLVSSGGLIREDVLAQIFTLDPLPTPFIESIGEDSFTNPYSEWTEDKLATANANAAVISGSDATGINDASVGNAKRVGNHAQINRKIIEITTRGENSTSVGDAGTMGYQTAKRTQELRYDLEATALSRQASIADDNNTQAGHSAGFSSWIKTNAVLQPNSNNGGFNTSTKVVDAPVQGDSTNLKWSMVRTGIMNAYLQGANPTILMTVPQVAVNVGTFLLTANNLANFHANAPGTTPANLVSQGYVNVFRTDFGFTMTIVPNRHQQAYNSRADVFGYDPSYVKVAMSYGYKVEPLAKLGLSDRKQVSTDWMLKVTLERAHFVIRDVAVGGTVVA